MGGGATDDDEHDMVERDANGTRCDGLRMEESTTMYEKGDGAEVAHRAALVASRFRGALPPSFLRAVCLVRAISQQEQRVGERMEHCPEQSSRE